METTVKTNYPFTKAQLKSLNNELEKISNTQVVSLKGVTIQGKKNYIDIQVLKSPYVLDVFLKFCDISLPEKPEFHTFKIDSLGIVDKSPRLNMEFHSLADRVTFFTQLKPVEFYTVKA